MFNLSRLELLDVFGFRSDPFKNFLMETADLLRIERLIPMAIKAHAIIVSLVGERGVGKTDALRRALRNIKVRRVIVRATDKQRLLISDIERAMLLDLGEEKIRRGAEIRARQLRRVVGEASRKEQIVLIVEEAHRLHGQTLRALKSLSELDWMGETGLFTVILLGQSDPMNKAGLSEVRLRSDTIHMKGLSSEEAAKYIKGTVGQVFNREAIEKVAEVADARNFLDLQNVVLGLMGRALANGREQVEIQDVTEMFGQSKPKVEQKRQTEKPEGGFLKKILDGKRQDSEPLAAVN